MKLVWLTDTHLDLVDEEGVDSLFDAVVELDPDVVLSGGDVGRSETFPDRLVQLADRVERPVYFVLGNHDHYGSSIWETEQSARELSQRHRDLHWLNEEGVVELDHDAVLIGHGLWGDGRAGRGERSSLELADHHLIADLVGLSRDQLFATLRSLGDAAADWARDHLARALDGASHVIFLTHVPPFAGPKRALDRASSDDVLPFYICTVVGKVILDLMASRPDKGLTVLSGHRHIALELEPAPNICAITGEAKYLAPAIQRVIDTAEFPVKDRDSDEGRR